MRAKAYFSRALYGARACWTARIGLEEKGGYGAVDHFYVGGFDVVGVDEAHDACDHHAPVSVLGYCEKRQRGSRRGLVVRADKP